VSTRTSVPSGAAHAVQRAPAHIQRAAQRGVQQVQRTAGHVAARVNANPVAQSVRRTASFAQRTLGHAQNIQTFGRGVGELAGKARTAVGDVRNAVRTRSLSAAGQAIRSVTDTARSAGQVVTQAREARTSLRNIRNDFANTFPRAAGRLSQTYQRAASVASNVAQRTGLNRVASSAQRLA